jgi:response regulator RpfG family c-di-GMP phosphodiesterase
MLLVRRSPEPVGRSDEKELGAIAYRIALAMQNACVAMTLDRRYRRALSPEEAQEGLRRHSGTQFDAAVVEALLEHARARSRRLNRRHARIQAWISA